MTGEAWWVRVYIDEQRGKWGGEWSRMMMMMMLERKRNMEGLGLKKGYISKTMGQREVWTVGIVFHSEL